MMLMMSYIGDVERMYAIFGQFSARLSTLYLFDNYAMRQAINILAVSSMAVLALSAFTKESRASIWERAGKKSELSGKSCKIMHCMHLNHSREYEGYNDPENGMLGTIYEHLAHHLLFRNNAHLIGLSEYNNEWAIQSLYGEIGTKLKPTETQLDAELSSATYRWGLHYGIVEA